MAQMPLPAAMARCVTRPVMPPMAATDKQWPRSGGRAVVVALDVEDDAPVFQDAGAAALRLDVCRPAPAGCSAITAHAGAYMRSSPNFVSAMGALRVAARPSASTRRVSAGAIRPASPRRAPAEWGGPGGRVQAGGVCGGGG